MVGSIIPKDSAKIAMTTIISIRVKPHRRPQARVSLRSRDFKMVRRSMFLVSTQRDMFQAAMVSL